MAYVSPESDSIVAKAKSTMLSASVNLRMAQAKYTMAKSLLDKAITDGMPTETLMNAALQADLVAFKANLDAQVAYLAAQAATLK